MQPSWVVAQLPLQTIINLQPRRVPKSTWNAKHANPKSGLSSIPQQLAVRFYLLEHIHQEMEKIIYLKANNNLMLRSYIF